MKLPAKGHHTKVSKVFNLWFLKIKFNLLIEYKMKTYSIGRDLNCDIVINDSTDVISRRHALLNVMPSGKMTIIDQSSNGTYVNGIRISPNVPFPVTRKDIVSLAHVSKLDWSMIPCGNEYMRYALYALAAIIIIICLFFGYKSISNSLGNRGNDTNLIQNDSARMKERLRYTDSLNRKRKADSLYLDSIQKLAKSRKDSLDKLRKDSITKKKESIKKNKSRKTKKVDDKKPRNKSKSKSKQDLG